MSGESQKDKLDSLFELVDCPVCEGKGKVTVSRESHDLELCKFCRGEKQVYAVVVLQHQNGGELTQDIVNAAASLYGTHGLTTNQWLVVHAYERAVYDARRVQSLMSSSGAQEDDFHMVTMYSGPASRYPHCVDADPRHNRIIIEDAEGNERELYRGTEFDEAKYQENLSRT